jgi:hypothetical protein
LTGIPIFTVSKKTKIGYGKGMGAARRKKAKLVFLSHVISPAINVDIFCIIQDAVLTLTMVIITACRKKGGKGDIFKSVKLF